MGRGNIESMFAHTMTSRHTNVPGANFAPSVHDVSCRRGTYGSHVEKRTCKPPKGKQHTPTRLHAQATTSAFAQTKASCSAYGANMHVGMHDITCILSPWEMCHRWSGTALTSSSARVAGGPFDGPTWDVETVPDMYQKAVSAP